MTRLERTVLQSVADLEVTESMNSTSDNVEAREENCRWKNTSFIVRHRVPEQSDAPDGPADDQPGRHMSDGSAVPDGTLQTSAVELNSATAVASSAAQGLVHAAEHARHPESEHGAQGEPISVLSPLQTEGPGQ